MKRRIRAEAGFVSNEQARKVLKKGGLDLTNEELTIVLEFLYTMANNAVSYYLKLPP
ncbi:hypothetical protein [Flavobacterium subsaxonicum]|uniref:hypothetical protein n=1 Tax=Flavobacterium subsaxonicum TaxID=426226 RepID=UPI0012B65BF8|nr:hypothetical protein [Flavobacterium subsaxonicum]